MLKKHKEKNAGEENLRENIADNGPCSEFSSDEREDNDLPPVSSVRTGSTIPNIDEFFGNTGLNDPQPVEPERQTPAGDGGVIIPVVPRPEPPKMPVSPEKPPKKPPETQRDPKKTILIILICFLTAVLLVLAGILIYKYVIKKPPEPPVEETTSENTTGEIAMTENSGIIHDGIVFSVDTKRKGNTSNLSEVAPIEKSAICVAGQVYHFPVLYDCFSKSDQWSCEETAGSDSVTCRSKNNVTIEIGRTAGLYPEDNTVSGSVVTELKLQGNDNDHSEAWILPGGITSASTAADVLAIYGDPNNTTHFSKDSFNTETTLIYKLQPVSRLSFSFAFSADGSIESVIIEAPETPQNKTQEYNSPFFKLTLPGYWMDRYQVNVDKDKNAYEFRYIGGGHLFTLFVHDVSQTFSWTMTESAIGRIVGDGKIYELICRFPTDDQSPEKGRDEFRLLANSVSLDYIKNHITPTNGYKTEEVDYSAFLGHYSADSPVEYEQGKELIVSKTNGEWITFSFGIYGGNHVQELKEVEIQVSNGEADFIWEDSMGCDCKGHIRLSEGTVAIKVEGAADPNATELYTNGTLTLYRSAVTGERPLRSFTKLTKGTTVDITVDENAKFYIGWELLDLTYSFGKEPFPYYNEENLYYYEEVPELIFEIKNESRNYPAVSDQKSVTRVILFGDHSLGGGLYPEMTLYELLEIFGASEFPSPDSQGGYVYSVYSDGYEYSYHWDGDYNEPSEYVYITKTR